MVNLYGVTHSLTVSNLFGRDLGILAVQPSEGFLKHLSRYPRGTKVGLECLSDEQWGSINRDLIHRYLTSINPVAIDLPSYPVEVARYWKELAQFCMRRGYEPIFLEDQDTFFRYNEALISLSRQRTIYNHFPRREEAVDLDYYREMLQCQESLYRAEVMARKIQELDRDKKLLQKVKSTGVEVAVVGVAHSDYWMANKASIGGIVFDHYHTDCAVPENHHYTMHFTEQATPSGSHLGDWKSLEHTVRLLENGRIGAKIPTYTGIWNPTRPSEGYFELMVEREEAGRMSGTIEDCMGIAEWSGEITSQRCHFVKRYIEAAAIAAQGDIAYEGERKGDEFVGSFTIQGKMRSPFYMKKYRDETPLELALRWYELGQLI